MKKKTLSDLSFHPKDGGVELRCLLILGVSVNFQLLQLSLCYPQFFSQILSVQGLFIQVVLNTICNIMTFEILLFKSD